MEAFVRLTAVALPLVRDNIDTDIIIPSREMKTVGKTGLKDGLFAGWRYVEIGGREPRPDFLLNDPDYSDARILLGGDNLGCGSSREHAVWALREYGFRVLIAPGFNPIFFNNCVRNGVVPVVLPREIVEDLARQVQRAPTANPLTVDLEHGVVVAPDGERHRFQLDEEHRIALLHGLDAIDLTLRDKAAIAAFFAEDRRTRPWAYL